MDIHYSEDDYGRGMICFSYTETFRLPDRQRINCRSIGMVPAKIMTQGKKMIKKYSEEYVKKEIAAQKNVWENLDRHLRKISKNIGRPISVKHRGQTLEGGITEITDSLDIALNLQKPFEANEFLSISWLIENKAKYFNNINRLLEEMIIVAFGCAISLRQEKITLQTLINVLNKD